MLDLKNIRLRLEGLKFVLYEKNMMKEYPVVDEGGKVFTYLNPFLVSKQQLDDAQVEALKFSHLVKKYLFDAAASHLSQPLILKFLAKVHDCLESEQQKLWNFKVDESYHRFFDFPGCSCPRMDNTERLGTPYKIFSEDCLIHGDSSKIKSKSSPLKECAEGYKVGYNSGRLKLDVKIGALASQFYDLGFKQGLKDGRCHRPKRDYATLMTMVVDFQVSSDL